MTSKKTYYGNPVAECSEKLKLFNRKNGCLLNIFTYIFKYIFTMIYLQIYLKAIQLQRQVSSAHKEQDDTKKIYN